MPPRMEQRLPTHERRPAPESREAEAVDRAVMSFFLESGDLGAEAALELVAGYAKKPDQDVLEGTRKHVESYGIDFDALPEQEQIKYATLWNSSRAASRSVSREQITDAFEKELNHALFVRALERVDEARQAVLESEDTEVLEARLNAAMEVMSELATHAAPDKDENDELWLKLYERFQNIMQVRPAAKEKGVNIDAVFENVVERNREFIEDEIFYRAVDYKIARGEPAHYERLMNQVYQRSPEEVEELKERNRRAVAEYIQKNVAEPPSVGILETLHRLNNKDLVPQRVGSLRKRGEQVTFLKRFGILGGEDVAEETERVMDRASRAMFGTMPDARYEIAVAALHNDLLEIHPFLDRNGSTALLFAEFMMSKRGYQPDPERGKSHYYHQLRRILGNNPLAVGLVAHTQWKANTFAGYYQGETTKKGTVQGVSKSYYYEKAVNAYIQRMKEAEKPTRQTS